MKKFVLGIIVGGLIFGSSVFAITSYLYSSNEVSYTPEDTSWTVSNVEQALNDLRNKAKNYMPIPTETLNIIENGSNIDVINIAKVNVNIPKTALEGDIKTVHNCVDGWHSSWITVDSWSKYRGFVVAAWAANGTGGISYGTIGPNGEITYTSKSSYASVQVSGNQIRGGEGIMSNVGVFLTIF